MKIILYMMVSLLVGCATPAMQQQMVINPLDVGVKANVALTNSVTLRNVSGGSATNPFWLSKVGTNEFKGALLESLQEYGYLSSSPEKGKIILDVNLEKLEQPIIGLTMSVVSVVSYIIEENGFQKKYQIVATGSASPSEEFIGYKRLKIANERSINENIRIFVRKLSSEIN